MANFKDLAEALLILAKYDDSGYVSAEHDIIFSGVSTEDLPEDSEDGARLIELGWHDDTEYDAGWSRFV